MSDPNEQTRASWNVATRNHNAHKGDQAAFLRGGGSTLFAEEVERLGDLKGLRVAHLQCNAGQDTLSLHRLGTPAELVGVDFADEAIAFARGLSVETGLSARFVCAELPGWLEATEARFDVVFASYGALPWLRDLDRYFAGVRRVLAPGGRFVYVEFHPLVWSFDADAHLTGDDYFADDPFVSPVGDYVARSGTSLHAVSDALVEGENEVPARAWQHTLGQIVTAAASPLRVVSLDEHPHANGCRVNDALVRDVDPRRWIWPPGTARVPLMFSLVAERG